jgi:N-acetylglucosaminyldiphosphoundecaprenol N-acetyl-beta-D-mannosaminyltransferase
MSSDRQLLFGLYFDPMRLDDVIDRCRVALKTRSRMMIGVLNAAKVVNLRKDATLRASLLECDILLADGQSIVWASRLLGRPLPERVAGIDVFESLLELAAHEGRPIYLLGARPEVLETMEARLTERLPGLRIAGRHHGYFAAEDAAQIAEDIRLSGAEMLFLGMVSPKKEIFLATFGHTLGVPILHGVGGSFDILAGIARRAPLAWQRTGMEWAYRLLQEPRRLLWRYASTNTAFVVLTIRELLRPTLALRVPTLPPHRLPGGHS